ncbi:hypothetical protein ES708_29659 [subsurface metagenome]
MTCHHLVDIAPQRIDLAVMTEDAKRLCKRPARKRVGAVTGVDDRNCGYEILRFQVRVKHRYLFGGEHALVSDDTAGKARNIE